MRIITEGKIPDEKEYEANCRFCNTTFAFKESDTWRKEGLPNSRDPREGSVLMLRCPLPLCGKVIPVAKNNPIIK